jgi:signal transduction histidine kinase
VPVSRGGAVVYDLSVGFFPNRLGDILHQEQLPANWIGSVFDSKGVYVARTRAADRFVGQKGMPALVNSIAQNTEGIVETGTSEGIPATALFSRSQVSNWAVVIYVPTAELTVQLWSSMALSTAATLALLALSLVAARFTGERLARPIRALATQALAHGRGERIELPPFRLKEADDLARAFAEGSRLLEERTAERDRAEGQRQQIIVAKQLADEAARARSAYFSYLSHELRTPLMAVLACSELMARHTRVTSLDEKSLNYCARIDTAVQHLISVINEILDYAKFEAHEIELHKEPLDIAKEVRGAVDLLEGRAEQTGVALRHEVAPNLPPLLADRMRLQQILLNLLSNALKFSPSGGTVTVSAALAEDAQLVIRVEDSGVGISDDDLPRVMQPFAQVVNAQTAKIKGTGLGLPLTKGLVELHGGTFTLSSVPNVGTTVTVRLPLDPAATEPLGRSRPLATLG